MSKKATTRLQQLLAIRLEAAAVHCGGRDEKQKEKEKPPVF